MVSRELVSYEEGGDDLLSGHSWQSKARAAPLGLEGLI
jgi:hypothetical protein